ncbi:hypothetical protein SKAU_G00143720 [Synaphobranchus kaupii]|uniref:Uncharacterized protein n=1 Tax=Synaphobranchus kaupii TaxID=118154 RepID=A0A9Q1J484_SYNKA|nr:hypothetical protein SKAU_G00143720 [Synaphobranchus kaupii]
MAPPLGACQGPRWPVARDQRTPVRRLRRARKRSAHGNPDTRPARPRRDTGKDAFRRPLPALEWTGAKTCVTMVIIHTKTLEKKKGVDDVTSRESDLELRGRQTMMSQGTALFSCGIMGADRWRDLGRSCAVQRAPVGTSLESLWDGVAEACPGGGGWARETGTSGAVSITSLIGELSLSDVKAGPSASTAPPSKRQCRSLSCSDELGGCRSAWRPQGSRVWTSSFSLPARSNALPLGFELPCFTFTSLQPSAPARPARPLYLSHEQICLPEARGPSEASSPDSTPELGRRAGPGGLARSRSQPCVLNDKKIGMKRRRPEESQQARPSLDLAKMTQKLRNFHSLSCPGITGSDSCQSSHTPPPYSSTSQCLSDFTSACDPEPQQRTKAGGVNMEDPPDEELDSDSTDSGDSPLGNGRTQKAGRRRERSKDQACGIVGKVDTGAGGCGASGASGRVTNVCSLLFRAACEWWVGLFGAVTPSAALSRDLSPAGLNTSAHWERSKETRSTAAYPRDLEPRRKSFPGERGTCQALGSACHRRKVIQSRFPWPLTAVKGPFPGQSYHLKRWELYPLLTTPTYPDVPKPSSSPLREEPLSAAPVVRVEERESWEEWRYFLRKGTLTPHPLLRLPDYTQRDDNSMVCMCRALRKTMVFAGRKAIVVRLRYFGTQRWEHFGEDEGRSRQSPHGEGRKQCAVYEKLSERVSAVTRFTGASIRLNLCYTMTLREEEDVSYKPKLSKIMTDGRTVWSGVTFRVSLPPVLQDDVHRLGQVVDVPVGRHRGVPLVAGPAGASASVSARAPDGGVPFVRLRGARPRRAPPRISASPQLGRFEYLRAKAQRKGAL